MNKQCGICGAFLPMPKAGERWRTCGRCGTELEVTPSPRAWPKVPDEPCTQAVVNQGNQ